MPSSGATLVPQTKPLKIRWIGPGLIMAVSGIGASDVISATIAGREPRHSFALGVGAGRVFKVVPTEGLARWQIASGITIVEGWARHLPRWVLRLFFGYLILWSIAVGGALLSGCGLAMVNITQGRVSFTAGALAHAAVVFLFIFTARTKRFASVMKPLIAVMFVSVVGCAAFTLRDPAQVALGLFLPRIPAGSGPYVLSLIGAIGGSLTLLNYGYLLREEGADHPENLARVRIDLAIAYSFTAVFGLSIMLIADRVFFSAGIAVSDGEAVSRMAGLLATLLGPAGFYVYSLGFWAAVLASLLAVWQTVPHIIAECWSLLRERTAPHEEAARQRRYRGGLIFMAAAAVPFAFLGKPLLLVVAFTILGSFFIPFLAATLLHLNNRVAWASPVRQNRFPTNLLLGFAVALFLALGVMKMYRLIQPRPPQRVSSPPSRGEGRVTLLLWLPSANPPSPFGP